MKKEEPAAGKPEAYRTVLRRSRELVADVQGRGLPCSRFDLKGFVGVQPDLLATNSLRL